MPDAQPPTTTESPSYRLSRAFQNVLGQPESRTTDQKLVAAALQEWARVDEPLFTPDAHGNYDNLRAAQTDGARIIWMNICRRLEQAKSPEKPQAPVIRGRGVRHTKADGFV